MRITLLLALTMLTIISDAQITVNATDFANAGDTVRVSVVTNARNLRYKYGGQDTLWNFSGLQARSQRIDTFLGVYNVGPAYSLYFSNTGINPHRSNIATKGQSNFPSTPLAPVSISNVYNFYYKNTSHYIQSGIGEQINSIETPIGFTSNDVLYNFPLNYGDADTSTSGYHINIPTLGYYEHSLTRTNMVDGWGTVITPYDTFQALRVVSQLVSSDSFYIDTLHFGFRQNQPTTRQYKWIATGMQEPVIQITATVQFGNQERVSEIFYRDIVHTQTTPTAIQETVATKFAVYPNPVNNSLTVANIPVNTPLVITNLLGAVVIKDIADTDKKIIDVSHLPQGMYFINGIKFIKQ